eukprot:scaffold21194_cov68-Phaeocystis_antarctica.AAC.2
MTTRLSSVQNTCKSSSVNVFERSFEAYPSSRSSTLNSSSYESRFRQRRNESRSGGLPVAFLRSSISNWSSSLEGTVGNLKFRPIARSCPSERKAASASNRKAFSCFSKPRFTVSRCIISGL